MAVFHLAFPPNPSDQSCRCRSSNGERIITIFTINSDHNIIAYPAPEAAQDALALGAEAFTSQKELAKLAANWPTSRLAETWNAFAGTAGFDDLKPVRKFENRAKAIARIWQAIQRLAPAVDGGAQDAPETASTSKDARTSKKATSSQKRAKEANAKPEAREGSKKAAIIAWLKRDQGATNQDIQQATRLAAAHSSRVHLGKPGPANEAEG